MSLETNVVAFTAGVVLVCNPAYAYLSAGFDVKTLMQDSDLVCKVRIESVRQSGQYGFEQRRANLRATRVVASAKVISTMKGKSSQDIQIAFPAATQTVLFTSLSAGEVAIVFLTGGEETFRFTDIDNGKMVCSSSVVPYQQADPQDRVFRELVALSASPERRQQLMAIGHLGSLGDRRAAKTLTRFSASPSPAIKGMALVSRIRIGDLVKHETLLRYLDQDPSLFDRQQSLDTYQTTAYEIASLNRQIMLALRDTLEPARNGPYREQFDYVSFFEQASATSAVAGSVTNRNAMAYALRRLADRRSIPLLIKLLDDSDLDVRYYAVTTLMTIHGDNRWPAVSIYQSSEKDYLTYWKNKLK